jgi:tetratricopeptide (TPR) repeat protein
MKEVKPMSHIWSDEEITSFKVLLRKISEKFESEEDVKEAKVVAKLLTEINPDAPEAWYFLGVVNGILGALDEAQNNLFRSLELGGEKFWNYVELANVFMKQGSLKEAIQWGYKSLEFDQENVFVCHKLADLHVLDGNARKAIKVLEPLLSTKSIKTEDKHDTLVRLGNLCMVTQRMKRALEYFKEAQKLIPQDESLWADIGHCLSRLENHDDALSAFKKAADSKPSPSNLYNLGDAYLSLNQPEKSIAPLVEATRKEPGYSIAHYDLSRAFIEMKKYREGAAAAMAALRPDPEMKLQRTNLGLGAMSNLGLCLMNLGRYEEALECFRRNKNLLAPTFFNTGLTLFRMKRYKEALEYFLSALAICPDDPEYLNLVGQSYAGLGKDKIAEKYLRKSIKKDPTYAMGYYDLGVILAKFKTRQPEALRCFMKAIKFDRSLAWAYYSVACFYALSGDKEKGLSFLKQSLEKGLRDKKHIDSDSDLDSLREEKEFKDMMVKYFDPSLK